MISQQKENKQQKQVEISIQEQQINKLLALGQQNIKKILKIQKNAQPTNLKENLSLSQEHAQVFNVLLQKGFSDFTLNLEVIQKFSGDEKKCLQFLQKNFKKEEMQKNKAVLNLLKGNVKEIQEMIEILQKQEIQQETPKKGKSKSPVKSENQEKSVQKENLKKQKKQEKKEKKEVSVKVENQEKVENSEKAENLETKKEKQVKSKSAEKKPKKVQKSLENFSQILLNGNAVINNLPALKKSKTPVKDLLATLEKFSDEFQQIENQNQNQSKKIRILLYLNQFDRSKIQSLSENILIFSAQPVSANANEGVKNFLLKQGNICENQAVIAGKQALPEKFQGNLFAPKFFAKILEKKLAVSNGNSDSLSKEEEE